MSKKKNKRQATASEVYALCITVGLIVGLGLSPLMGNTLIMIVTGGAGGAVIAYLFSRKASRHGHRRHHH
ncbi:MAG: hypothetical protein R3F41_02595 [Gammaproteobacteria bacterium]|nr:hypothetical protein [Pseudomonadales bacterium]MCP5345818.1 hypothetical protein [Pseudomonadales bacterium]